MSEGELQGRKCVLPDIDSFGVKQIGHVTPPKFGGSEPLVLHRVALHALAGIYLSLPLLTSPYLSLPLLTSPYLSLSLLTSPYLSLSLPTSPYPSVPLLISPSAIVHTCPPLSNPTPLLKQRLRKTLAMAEQVKLPSHSCLTWHRVCK